MRTYPNWAHSALINWGRYENLGAAPGPVPQQTCCSYEKHYKAPPWESCEPEDKPPTIDEASAQQIARIWHQLPSAPRKVLQVSYAMRPRLDSERDEANFLGMPLRHYRDALNKAAWLMIDRLNGKG